MLGINQDSWHIHTRSTRAIIETQGVHIHGAGQLHDGRQRGFIEAAPE
jgi:hypothetical protein